MVSRSVVLLLFALVAVGCVSQPPMPNDIPKVNAWVVLDDYTNNEERANRAGQSRLNRPQVWDSGSLGSDESRKSFDLYVL